MNLFLDTISPRGTLIAFDDTRNILHQIFFDVLGKESTQLIEIFDQFLRNISLSYHDIEHIIVVAGPGSFTGVRTTILMVNTVNFVIKKTLTPISYFDLFDVYPIVKTSSKRDVFAKMHALDTIGVYTNVEILEKCQDFDTIATDATFFERKNIRTSPDYERIIRTAAFQNLVRISPIYIKNPNIS